MLCVLVFGIVARGLLRGYRLSVPKSLGRVDVAQAGLRDDLQCWLLSPGREDTKLFALPPRESMEGDNNPPDHWVRILTALCSWGSLSVFLP